jgi:centromere/kinetochore protein ZW10
MPSKISEKELGDAIIQSVEHGVYPESEDVASAELPPTALPNLLEAIGKARENVKVRVFLGP